MSKKLSEHVVSLHTTAHQLEQALRSVRQLLDLPRFRIEEEAKTSGLLGDVPMRLYEASINYRLISNGRVPVLDSPDSVVGYMADVPVSFPAEETFWVIFLDRKNRAIARNMVSRGTLTATTVHSREVFKAAILASAASVVFLHNHPSGDPAPSSADITITRLLREAGRVLDILVVDHVIQGRPEADPTGLGYYSFREAGVL